MQPPAAKPATLKHLAFIMDGNRRWAVSHHTTFASAYRNGFETMLNICDYILEKRREVKWLSFYAFSEGNWKRKLSEILVIIDIMQETLRSRSEDIVARGIRFRAIGNKDKFGPVIAVALQDLEAKTVHFNHLTLDLFLSYDGQTDITEAIEKANISLTNSAARGAAKGATTRGALIQANTYTAEPPLFTKFLQNYPAPNPEILIRTGGYSRLSGFMLWQLAYTELLFPRVLWPEFTTSELDNLLEEYIKAGHLRLQGA